MIFNYARTIPSDYCTRLRNGQDIQENVLGLLEFLGYRVEKAFLPSAIGGGLSEAVGRTLEGRRTGARLTCTSSQVPSNLRKFDGIWDRF